MAQGCPCTPHPSPARATGLTGALLALLCLSVTPRALWGLWCGGQSFGRSILQGWIPKPALTFCSGRRSRSCLPARGGIVWSLLVLVTGTGKVCVRAARWGHQRSRDPTARTAPRGPKHRSLLACICWDRPGSSHTQGTEAGTAGASSVSHQLCGSGQPFAESPFGFPSFSLERCCPGQGAQPGWMEQGRATVAGQGPGDPSPLPPGDRDRGTERVEEPMWARAGPVGGRE